MQPRIYVLLLCITLALAAGEVRAQQANCPNWMPGIAASANCAAARNLAASPAAAPGTVSGLPLGTNWSLGANAGTTGGIATPAPLAQTSRDGLDRSYAGADLNGSYWFGRSQLATRFSLSQGVDRLNGAGAPYSLPDYRSSWSQAAAPARYGYWFDGFMPYASLTLASDLSHAGNPALQALGSGAWIPRMGVDFFAKRDFSGGISYSSEQGSVVKNQVWSANLNFRF
ncbi:MAG TPA: hypothetical protein VH105_10625 [Burkholderiales bacterium]|nr:hypothetical protein [Burkholderiales bacterium]